MPRRLTRLHRNRSGILLAALCLLILVDPHDWGSVISIAFLAVAVVALLGFAVSPYRTNGQKRCDRLLLLLMTISETLVELRVAKHRMEPVAHATTALFTAGIIAVLLRYVLDR
jgi:hypothetical protein